MIARRSSIGLWWNCSRLAAGLCRLGRLRQGRLKIRTARPSVSPITRYAYIQQTRAATACFDLTSWPRAPRETGPTPERGAVSAQLPAMRVHRGGRVRTQPLVHEHDHSSVVVLVMALLPARLKPVSRHADDPEPKADPVGTRQTRSFAPARSTNVSGPLERKLRLRRPFAPGMSATEGALWSSHG
jgi:hypothetical protein